MNEGVKRLAIFFGGIGTLAWLAYVGVATEFFTKMEPSDWKLIIGISVPCFLVPFGIVHGVAWVVKGFR